MGAEGVTADGAERAPDLPSGAGLALARQLEMLLQSARDQIEGEAHSSPLTYRLSDHLGMSVLDAVVVSASLPSWEHVGVYRGVQAYLGECGDAPDWLGLRSQHREHMPLVMALRSDGQSAGRSLAPADYTDASAGPDTVVEVVSFGLVCAHAPDGSPVVIALSLSERHGPPQVVLDVLAGERAAAKAALDRVRALAVEHDVMRGQVVTFSVNEHYGNSLVSFLPRASVTQEQVILPEGLRDRVVDYVIGTGRHAEALRRNGIHLKRGILLYGPPGTGKTHLVRYLTGLATGTTVVILSGNTMHLIDQAAAVARRLSPSMVVIEDVDLVAQDRSFSPTGNPFLFTLLDAMDGVGGDADITFLLTTNRASDLEEAIVQRPGRIDLAIEVPRPGPEDRERLLRLYAGSADLEADLGAAVAATEGATASAMKELMRRAVILAVHAATPPRPEDATVTITDAVLAEAVAQYETNRDDLARALRGSDEFGVVDDFGVGEDFGVRDDFAVGDDGTASGWDADGDVPPGVSPAAGHFGL